MWGSQFSWELGGPSPPQNFSDCLNGTAWVWNVFNECAANGRDLASVYLGLFSILCFVAASFPQYYKSCKTGNMDRALSIWFLLGWLAGDSCNFVGAFLSHQLPIQVSNLYARTEGCDHVTCARCHLCLFRRRTRRFITCWPISSCFLSTSTTSTGTRGRAPFSTQEIIGCTIGSISSMFYLCSRLPQIVTNFRRRSTEGLALSLFFMVILGNLTYGLSILLKNPDNGQSEANYIEHHLPWLIGSLGVMSLDLIIIFQFFVFRGKSSADSPAAEREPLLQ
ncbi:hypothetical protein GDO78_011420 [Eleutherodactylus coqui]|uniref:Lysosomal amino acid transporter 1 homolog n=1 Tax=Eleutherodactylus coqui TaxID=57060 RepID=A0A8J6F800_ELECQ|nr:hypothetical protein GDO78_011420 [Eleutherodactylus coqui]